MVILKPEAGPWVHTSHPRQLRSTLEMYSSKPEKGWIREQEWDTYRPWTICPAQSLFEILNQQCLKIQG